MRRRGAGVGRIRHKRKTEAKLDALQGELDTEILAHMQKQVAVFKENLEKFAQKHKEEIKKDPVFRQQFTEMCQTVGVDPLASHKGFWSQLLGVGDFYYELAVQAIDICLSTRDKNGGLITVEELLALLRVTRGGQAQRINASDVTQAVKKVSILGNGFQILQMGQGAMVVTVPIELNTDHSIAISMAEASGYITYSSMHTLQGWSTERTNAVVSYLMEEGMLWVDKQPEEARFYFPSIFYVQQ